jgi:hypothetical protein
MQKALNRNRCPRCMQTTPIEATLGVMLKLSTTRIMLSWCNTKEHRDGWCYMSVASPKP